MLGPPTMAHLLAIGELDRRKDGGSRNVGTCLQRYSRHNRKTIGDHDDGEGPHESENTHVRCVYTRRESGCYVRDATNAARAVARFVARPL
jgi:hypothetical protein